MDSAIEGSHEILLARLKELLGIYGKDAKNMRKVLRAFYKMVVFDEEFDNALIEFLKQVIVNFIKRYASIVVGADGTLQNTIMKYEHISLENFINRRVLPFDVDPTKMIFMIVPLAMGVELYLQEYPKLSEDNLGFYANQLEHFRPRLASPFEAAREKIYLLRTSMIFYDILYTAEEIMGSPSLVGYDKELDVLPVTDPEIILAAVCCSKGYYLPGYYRTMLKRTGTVSKVCIVCGKDLDDSSYKKLVSYRWRMFPYAKVVTGALTFVAYGVSMFFVLTHGLSGY